MKPLPYFLRALESRNYRIYLSGQCVSYLGNWMTATASLWLAYHLSGSPFIVGLVGFANWIPLLVLAPFAGVLVDRIDGLKLVRITQTLAMLQTGVLAALTLSGHITVPTLIGLCLLQGLIYSFDDSARQMLLVGLAGDRALLDNVIALNSITINLTRLVGPALSGLIIAGMGPGVCYSIDACAYLPALAALSAVRIAPAPARRPEAHPLVDLRDGLAYAWDHAPIRRVLLLVSVISLVGFTHTLLAPVFARDVFGGDARTLGFLMSTSGIGSLIGGAFLSTRRGAFAFPRAIAGSTFIGSAGFFGIAISPTLPWGLLCYAAAGLGATTFLISTNTWLQQVVADDKRGRILSLYGMGQGFYPIGSLLLGAFTAGIGPRVAIAFCGLVLLASGIWFVRAFFRPQSPSDADQSWNTKS